MRFRLRTLLILLAILPPLLAGGILTGVAIWGWAFPAPMDVDLATGTELAFPVDEPPLISIPTEEEWKAITRRRQEEMSRRGNTR
jgi:hypothetical protein